MREKSSARACRCEPLARSRGCRWRGRAIDMAIGLDRGRRSTRAANGSQARAQDQTAQHRALLRFLLIFPEVGRIWLLSLSDADEHTTIFAEAPRPPEHNGWDRTPLPDASIDMVDSGARERRPAHVEAIGDQLDTVARIDRRRGRCRWRGPQSAPTAGQWDPRPSFRLILAKEGV